MQTRVVVPALLALLILGGISLLPRAAEARACHVTATQIDFGQFDPFHGAKPQSVGYITYRCSNNVTNVRITLSPGQSKNSSQRLLYRGGGGTPIPYILTLDASQTQIWGDGFGATSLYMVGAAPAQTDIRVPVYAYLASTTLPAVGLYSDTISVQLTWD
jgi:spore coat protein U-like protein